MKSTYLLPSLLLCACAVDPGVEPAVEASVFERPYEAPPTAPEPAPAVSASLDPMPGFSWVDEAVLAGLPLPGGHRPRTVEQDLEFLRAEGVEILVSLTETPTDPDLVDAWGLHPVHLPIPDFQPPTQDQLDAFTATVARGLSEHRPVAVHCHAGLGRTGTMLAGWFVHEGMDAAEAIARVRSLRPGSIETASQEAAIEVYAERLWGPSDEIPTGE